MTVVLLSGVVLDMCISHVCTQFEAFVFLKSMLLDVGFSFLLLSNFLSMRNTALVVCIPCDSVTCSVMRFARGPLSSSFTFCQS